MPPKAGSKSSSKSVSKPSQNSRNKYTSSDNSVEYLEYFGKQYQERWPALLQALLQPTKHIALENPHVCDMDVSLPMATLMYSSRGCKCYMSEEHAAKDAYPPPIPDAYLNIKPYYWMDFASVLPPLLLAPQPGSAVLDMCAAPGGKSLILAQQLFKPAVTFPLLALGARQGGGSDVSGSSALHPGEGGTSGDDQKQQVQQQTGAVLKEGQEQEHAAAEAQAGAGAAEAAGSSEQAAEQQQQQAGAGEGAPSVHSSPGSVHSGPGRTADAAAEEDGSPAAGRQAAAAPGRLVCNEVDFQRRQRLSSVLQEYLPASCRKHVKVVGHDAVRYWGTFERALYDYVLLDAPCSSDRHVLQQAVRRGCAISQADWCVAKCREIGQLQAKLLCAGLRALKPGGRLVYSTCSLAAVQNDEVVGAALQQHSDCSVAEPDLPGADLQLFGAQRTKLGLICLPDTAGWGPIYVAVISKSQAS